MKSEGLFTLIYVTVAIGGFCLFVFGLRSCREEQEAELRTCTQAVQLCAETRGAYCGRVGELCK